MCTFDFIMYFGLDLYDLDLQIYVTMEFTYFRCTLSLSSTKYMQNTYTKYANFA